MLIMRIGYVLTVFPTLSESFVINEIVALIDQGHDVSIFSINLARENVTHPEVKEYDLLNRTHYFSNSNGFAKKLKMRFNSLDFFITVRGWKYPAKNFRFNLFYIEVSQYFSKIAKNLDVFHAHFNGISTHVAMLMSKKLGIPFTFTVHAFDIFMNPDVKALKKRVEEAKAVIAISHYNQELLCSLTGIEKEKIAVIRACPMLNKFKETKRESDSFTAITVARLVEKKGIRYAILAIKELMKEYPNIQYRIIGSGHLENELKALVSSFGLENNVTFLGNLEDDSLIEELRTATMFILPCIRAENGDMDGIPVSLMEAMYSGIPVVSTRISGIPELIENGQEGILIEPKNSKQLSNAIKTLLEDKNLRTKLGENGKRKIETQFNIYNETAKLIDVWKN